MNIQQTLYFFRTNKKLTQRDVLKYVDASVYSKIETGKKHLKFSELIEILNRLSIPFDEFSKYAGIENTQKTFRQLLDQYKQTPHDPIIKKQLYIYFYQLNFSKEMPLDQLSNYILFKAFFSSVWAEITPLTTHELEQIFELLNEKEYFFHYDYAILANTIYLFSDKQIDCLMQKAFPVKDMDLRNAATKEFISNLINNLITTLIKKEEFKQALFYLNLAKKENQNYDLSYKIIVDFLENLVFFIQTKDICYAQVLTNHINYLTNVGESDLAQNLKTELESLVAKDTLPPLILRNYFNQ